MATTSEVPVLIVGGGAVGCVLSMELARRGIEFRCIDRMPAAGRESRAIALHARTIELLDLVDKELSRKLLDRDLWCKGYVMHFLRDGERTEVRPGLDYTTVDSRYNCILSHNQSETEGFVRDYTKTRFGKGIEYNTKFEDLTQDGDGVTARVTHSDRGDEEELIRCQYLVAADGINSRVRRGLGLSVKGKDYTGSFFQNLDIHLHGFPDWKDYFHYCVGTDHFLMVAPLPGGHFRLLLSDRGEAADPNITPQQAFMRLLERHYDGITMGDVVWHSKWETWVRLADTFRQGNVFLAGDSAHVHSTTGGQGMNCCMQDAFNLGWKLALVLKGYAGSELLNSYETERRPIAEQVIWAASSLHDIFMTHGKDIAQRKQTMFEPGYTEKVVNYCSGVAYTYKDPQEEPAGSGLDGPAIGDRAPDVDLENGGTLFDRLRNKYFTLLAMPGDRDLASVTAPLEKRFGAVLTSATLSKSAALSRRYGASDGRLFLVRPDGYIAFKARSDEARLLEEFLTRTLFSLAMLIAVIPAIVLAQGGIQYDKIEIKTDKVAPNLYMLSGSENVDPGHPDGAGGRIGVLAGPDGIFMVDSQYLQIGDKVLAAVRQIDPGPIRFLVNTHIHGDHTAGNATFAKLGAVLLAREELREGLVRQQAAAQAPARDPARLPILTYGMGDPVRFRMNGETVELIPVRAAHTGGDTMVRFVNADVIMIGDFYRNFGYPFIDTNNGGSLKGALEGLELTMKIAGPATRLIPGHGTYINRTDIIPYRDMMLDVRNKVQQLIAQGKTLQEVLAAKVTASYDAKVPGGLLPAGAAGTSADRFVSMVYSQLKEGQ